MSLAYIVYKKATNEIPIITECANSGQTIYNYPAHGDVNCVFIINLIGNSMANGNIIDSCRTATKAGPDHK